MYVYVPAGPFTMGSGAGDPSAYDSEKPQTTVNTDAFWIMRTEVTNAQYAKCVAAGKCTAPNNNTRWDDSTYAEHPVVYVTWYDANDYAKWVGGRLPTEAEWEKACRGTDGRIYPWGNEPPTAELANFDMNVGGTTSVGNYPKGVSPYGVLDMAGNLWEWTATKWTDNYQNYQPDNSPEGDAWRVVRGGAFSNFDETAMRCAARVDVIPVRRRHHFGFRVVTS